MRGDVTIKKKNKILLSLVAYWYNERTNIHFFEFHVLQPRTYQMWSWRGAQIDAKGDNAYKKIKEEKAVLRRKVGAEATTLYEKN